MHRKDDINMRRIALALIFALLVACTPEASEPIPTPSPTPTSTPSPTPTLAPTSETELSDTSDSAIVYDPVAHNFMPYDQPFGYGNMLSREQVLEDYLYMWQTLEDNAPYLAYMSDYPQWTDNTPQEIKARHEQKIKELPDFITLERYQDLFSAALSELERTGHIYVVNGSLHSLLQIVYDESALAEMDSADKRNISHRLSGLVKNQKTLEYYQYNESTSSNSGSDTADGSNKLQEIFDREIQFDIKDGSPYVKISAFGSAPAEVFLEYVDYAVERLKAFCEENKDAENIIIDIRGNGGGSTKIWEDGLVTPLQSSDTLIYYQLLSSISGSLNTYLWDGKHPESPSNEWEEKFPSIKNQYTSRFNALYLREKVYNGERVGFDGRIWLLVDRWCFSSSEMLTSLSKQTGFATVVGTQTGGSGITGSTPYTFPLPNSGMLIYYEPWYGFNDDGTCNQIVGTEPDIDVGKRDALEVCMELIAAG